MKKLLILGMTLLMMSSCVKHAQVYMLLSEEEAAAIPYQMGQTVKFLNQNGDTITYEVTRDVTYPYNSDQYLNAINGGDVMHLERYNYNCYARTVILTTDGQPYNNRFCFTIRPEKDFTFSFRYIYLSHNTCTVKCKCLFPQSLRVSLFSCSVWYKK